MILKASGSAAADLATGVQPWRVVGALFSAGLYGRGSRKHPLRDGDVASFPFVLAGLRSAS